MKLDKEVVAELAKLDNWKDFEGFVAQLYKNSSHQPVIKKNIKQRGNSTRMREVDVLASFQSLNQNLTLGIECKFWNRKVDGDVVDVVVAKKEDLNIDRFAIITTIGYEAGAKEYARYKGVDIFVIRPTIDEDFVDTGSVVKVQLSIRGSRPKNIGLECRIVGAINEREPAHQFLRQRILDVPLEFKGNTDPVLNLYDYSVSQDPITNRQTLNQGALYGNLMTLINSNWEEQYRVWHQGGLPALDVILDTEGLGIFLEKYKCVALVKKIFFEIEYSESRTHHEFDRTLHFPLVLENVIERSTQLIRKEKNPSLDYRLFDTVKELPPDSIGRDGLHISIYLRKPIAVSEPSEKCEENYILAYLNSSTLCWTLYSPTD